MWVKADRDIVAQKAGTVEKLKQHHGTENKWRKLQLWRPASCCRLELLKTWLFVSPSVLNVRTLRVLGALTFPDLSALTAALIIPACSATFLSHAARSTYLKQWANQPTCILMRSKEVCICVHRRTAGFRVCLAHPLCLCVWHYQPAAAGRIKGRVGASHQGCAVVFPPNWKRILIAAQPSCTPSFL